MTLDEARKNLSRTLWAAINHAGRVPAEDLSDPVAEAIESFVRVCLGAVVGPKITERNLPMWSPKTEKEPPVNAEASSTIAAADYRVLDEPCVNEPGETIGKPFDLLARDTRAEPVLTAIAHGHLRPHYVEGWWQVCWGDTPVALLSPEQLAPLALAGDTAVADALKRASDCLRRVIEETSESPRALGDIREDAQTALSIVDDLRRQGAKG